jgi:hypothetical protein
VVPPSFTPFKKHFRVHLNPITPESRQVFLIAHKVGSMIKWAVRPLSLWVTLSFAIGSFTDLIHRFFIKQILIDYAET